MENYLKKRSGTRVLRAARANTRSGARTTVAITARRSFHRVLYWPHMSAPRAVPHARIAARAALAVTTLVAIASPVRALSPTERHLTSARHGISVEAPGGWSLSRHTGYIETLALLMHPDGSRISITAAPTKETTGGSAFERSRPGLVAQGLLPGATTASVRGSFAVVLDVPARGERVRQLYLVRPIEGGRQLVVLTLVSRAAVFASHVAALDFVAERLGLDEPAAPTAAQASGALPGAGGSGGQAGAPHDDRKTAPQQPAKR